MKAGLNLIAAGLLCLGVGAARAQPILQFVTSGYSVAESAGSVTLTVRRTGDTNAAVTVDYATADGTAASGLKYIGTNGTLTFPAGLSNQTIVVTILNDGLAQGIRTFQVGLGNPTGGAVLGTLTNAIVSIRDNDIGVQFQFTNYPVAEDAGAVQIGVVRGDDGTNSVSVDFTTSDLTGSSGTDYTGVAETLVFAPQERLKFVPVPILNNSVKQANRTFSASLGNPVGLTLGNQITTTVTIVDNDQGFQFDSSGYSVAEDAGVARVVVLRGTDDTNSPVTVDFATTDGTATNGVDYVGVSNTLSFASGEKLKPVVISLLNDGTPKQNRNFHVTLSNPTGAAELSSTSSVLVSIININPGVSFESNRYSVWENAGAITAQVLRGNNGALGQISVDYATSDGTAKAGQDYQAVTNTLTFRQNETIKSITIPILRNPTVTNNTFFRVTLSNPTGGATLGFASSVMVNITDATGLGGTYRTVAPPFETALAIRQDGGANLMTWAGGGQLRRSDVPTGPWQTLTATNSYAFRSTIPSGFYRVARPRPVNVYAPSGYNGQTPLPLVILLHAYTYTGTAQETYMRFQPLAETKSFLYCYPDSTSDSAGNPFWNATDTCCDFFNTGVDDASSVYNLILEIQRQFAVDSKRIYLIGHSSGGFMAYRMACQFANLVAGIASLAGMPFLDPSRCQPFGPVNILHIHGTSDSVIPYAGSAITAPSFPANMPAFPGAVQSVQIWASYNGASGPATDPSPSMHLDLDTPGLDTTITRYTNSPPGGAVELWTMNQGTHFPTLYTNGLASDFAPRVIDWLLAHPKP